jgi:RND family efflux transporter MFP subunit
MTRGRDEHPGQAGLPQAAPPAKKRRVGALIAVAAVVGLAAFTGVRVKETLAERAAMAQAAAGATAPAAPAPAVVRGKPAAFRPVVPVTGTLTPIQEADLGFKIGGRLASVSVDEGDVVRAGQMLASLDCAEARAQAAAATAGVRAAEAGLRLADDAATRTKALFASSTVSEAERVGAELRLAAASADVERARAGARLAAVAVESCGLAAPFGGVVTRAPAGVGKIVAPGEPLFHVQDVSTLELRATVSEVDRALVELGADLDVAPDAVAGGGPEGKSGAAARGRVTAVLPSLDRQTRRLPIVAAIPNPGTTLLAGAFVRAQIHARQDAQVLELPGAALRPGSQDEIVVVSQGKLVRRAVTFTRSEAGALLVRDGLSPNEDVLASPSADVRDGAEAPAAHAAK